MSTTPNKPFRGDNIITNCPYCGGRIQLCDGWLAHLDPECDEWEGKTSQEIAEAWAEAANR